MMGREDLRSSPPGSLVVAAGQAACTPLDINANVAAAADLVFRAADQGADLLVLPELFLTGYELSAIVREPDVYTVNGDDSRLDPLALACGQTHTVVVVGAPTRDPMSGNLHISALVLGRSGRVVARYDKQHVDTLEREAGFHPGVRGCSIILDGWRVGLSICWDASYPEHARTSALGGCDVYLIGAMFPGERGARKRGIVGAARAIDNAMYVAAANHIGRSGPYVGSGGSAVWDPEGVLLADADEADPGLACVRLDPQRLARTRAEDFALMDPSLTAPELGTIDVVLD